MKVAMVCPYDLGIAGGVQAQVLGLARGLRGRGVEVAVIAPGEPDRPEPGLISVGKSLSVPANGSRAPINLNPFVSRRVRRAMKDADVVHVHEPFMPFVGWAALVGTTPAVLTFHANPSPAVRRLYQKAGGLIPRSAVVTAVSSVAAEAIPRPVTIIPNGIDLPDMSGSAQKDRNQVVFVGRDEPRKGLRTLLEAWPQLRRNHPGASLLVVGGADRAAMDGVQFVGRVDDAEKNRILIESGVLVAPNLGGESFGIVVAEGMAAGCAVVASDLPAFRAVLGECGLFFHPGNVSQLGSTLESLLGDPRLSAQLGVKAREAAETFRWDAILDRYTDLYRGLVGF